VNGSGGARADGSGGASSTGSGGGKGATDDSTGGCAYVAADPSIAAPVAVVLAALFLGLRRRRARR
jgi:MYXO-CTERM domain-containing protein